ncbi:MAG: CBS domain-containing protein [Desulfobacterales bacterium]|jgi:IMP dehydrogenase
MLVQELLTNRKQKVFTITPDQTVEEAITEMALNKTSALIVMEGDYPVGIFAERDVLRCHLKEKGKAFNQVKVKDAMTNKLISAKPEDEIGTAVSIMLKADIRHLPVLKHKKVIGMLTINDLVEHQISILNAELQHLQGYLADLHDAGKD